MQVQSGRGMTAMKRHIPNILTTLRIGCSLGLLFCEALSPVFIILYIIAGITDMLDGFAARKLNAVSFFGERYDSAADVLFIGICLFKILPVLNLKIWHIIWMILIAVIKGSNVMFSYLYHRKKRFLHSTANRITGLMLFLSPLLIVWFPREYVMIVLCVVATFAAVQEGHYIRTGKMESGADTDNDEKPVGRFFLDERKMFRGKWN